jgi:hypothetical protein
VSGPQPINQARTTFAYDLLHILNVLAYRQAVRGGTLLMAHSPNDVRDLDALVRSLGKDGLFIQNTRIPPVPAPLPGSAFQIGE